MFTELGDWTLWSHASPAGEGDDAKDQDAHGVHVDGAAIGICVADGTTTSVHSREAARAIAASVRDLAFGGTDEVRKVIDDLESMRAAAPDREIRLDSVSPDLRASVRAALIAKLQRGFQSTMATAHLVPTTDGLMARFRQCGDSGVIVWSRAGRPLYANIPHRWIEPTQTEGDPTLAFDHRSLATAVLPDHRDAALQEPDAQLLPADAVVMIGTDGYFDAFDDPAEAWAFFVHHGRRKSAPGSIAEELHGRLRERRGDDDVTVVVAWQRRVLDG